MKKMLLPVLFLVLAGSVQAQHTPARTSDQLNVAQESSAVGQAPSLLPVTNETRGGSEVVGTTSGALKKTQTPVGLTEIGSMANTYAFIGENRSQIAYDPETNTVAVVFRGNDRGTSSGNTLYIRYSEDGGITWSGQGDNVASSASPRYPNIFLQNRNRSANPADVNTAMIWPQSMTYPGGTSTWGEVYSMHSGLHNSNPLYSQFSAPPTWLIPWQIVPDQLTGNLYTMVNGLEPSNGTDLQEIYIMESTDDGKSWTMLPNPAWTDVMIPNGYFASNVRLDVSPKGTMMISMGLIQESEPGRAFLLDENHEIAWWTSDDHGATWGAMQRLQPLIDIPDLPSPFDTGLLKMGWDFDGILDMDDNPHFLIICSADINPFGISDDLIVVDDSTFFYNTSNVDSTFVCEVMVADGKNWFQNVGPVRRISTNRLSFAQEDGTAARFGPELKWARNVEGSKLYAKWVTPMESWHLEVIAEQLTLFQDTIHNVYVNGRHAKSRSPLTNVWANPWLYGSPSYDQAEADSINDLKMRMTDNEHVMAKYSKMAYYASNDGDLHIVFVEWGIGENMDDDPIFTDQTVWYVGGGSPDLSAAVRGIFVGVDDPQMLPSTIELAQNYPNPFNPGTTIRYSLPAPGNVTLKVFNMLGSEVATLVEGSRSSGTHHVNFDAADLPSGMYVYRLETASASISKKMVLMK